MSDSLLASADRIVDGINVSPADIERILMRAGRLCRLRQQDQSKRLSASNCDEGWVSWVNGYIGGWGDAADFLSHVADVIGDGNR